jgi:hypothetical protein
MGNQQSNGSSQPPDPTSINDQLCDAECQKQKDIQQAFQAYTAAQSNPNADPATVSLLRFQYLSLKNGPTWAAQEKARIAKQRVDPIVNNYRQQYQQLDGEYQSSRQLTDIVSALEQKQSNIKNTLEEQLKYIDKSISEKQSKMDVYNRSIELQQEEESESLPQLVQSSTLDPLVKYFSEFPQSFITVLDVFIAILIFFMLAILYRKFSFFGETLTRSGFLPPRMVPPPQTAEQSAAAAATSAVRSQFRAETFRKLGGAVPFLIVVGAFIASIILILHAYGYVK